MADTTPSPEATPDADQGVFPQTLWERGRHFYGGEPHRRMSRQMELATKYCADLPTRRVPVVVQLVNRDWSVRCYYTHPFARWACQEGTFFQVMLYAEGAGEPYQIIPSCPVHLSYAYGLGVEIMEQAEVKDASD